MRRILSMLCEVRQLQLEKQGAPATRLAEVADMYRFADSALSGINMSGPESKLGEVMTSADFTYAIMEWVQRQLFPAYTEKRFDFEQFMKPDTVPNFLDVTRYQRRAALDDLEYVADKGQARPGSFVDATKRQYRVYVWEKQYDFSMQTLVNDDLGYFADTAREMGLSARRTLEKFVSNMLWNATTLARLTGLGALYFTNGRLTTARISTARMAFNQRTDTRGNPLTAALRYIIHHAGLVDTVAQIQNSTLVPELATNAVNVVRGTFVPIEDPHLAGTAPDLPWYAMSDFRNNNIIPFVLARRNGVPAPMVLRKKSDIESVSSISGAGGDVGPMWGDFMSGNIVLKVHDEWGTYVDGTEGNLFDFRGAYHSTGTAP